MFGAKRSLDPIIELSFRRDIDGSRHERNWRCMTRLVVESLYRETGIYDNLDKEWRKRSDRQAFLAANPSAPLTRREIRESYVPPSSPFSVLYSMLIGAHSGKRVSRKAEKIDELRRNVEAGTNISSLRPERLVGMMALSLTQKDESGYFVVDTNEMLEAMEASDPLEREEGATEEIEELLQTFTTHAPRPMSALDQRSHAATVFMGSRMLNEPGTENALITVVGPQRIDYVAVDPTTLGVRVTSPYLPLEGSRFGSDVRESRYKVDPDSFQAIPLFELVEASRI